MEADLRATAAARKQTSSAFHPRLDIEVSTARNDDTDSTAGTNDDGIVVVWMSFKLFLGGGDRAGMNEAEAREFVTRKALRSVGRTEEEDVTLIWNELEDILIRLKHLEDYVDSTTEVLKVYKGQLALNTKTLLDLLDVKNELLRGKIAAISGRYIAILARYRVLASC